MTDWAPIIKECAPQVAPSVIRAVIHTESAFNPLAINLNRGAELQRQPKSKSEAVSWAQWLIKQGYSVDLGLMQINSANLASLNLDIAEVFDPCSNLQAGARILIDNYSRAIRQTDNSQIALLKALSAYNTGNFERGFRNGYVGRVIRASTKTAKAAGHSSPVIKKKASRKKPAAKKRRHWKGLASPIESHTKAKSQGTIDSVLPYQAATAVEGFNAAGTEVEGFRDAIKSNGGPF